MSSCRLLNPDKPGQSDMLMSFTDVTNERAAADKVMFYASHDALTELPNRVSVLRRLKKALAPTHEGEPLRWVLFIDIDELKATNDTHGHTVGDELLRAAANCLRGVVTAGDVVGRLGGDEFVVLIFRDLTRDELDGVIELPAKGTGRGGGIRCDARPHQCQHRGGRGAPRRSAHGRRVTPRRRPRDV